MKPRKVFPPTPRALAPVASCDRCGRHVDRDLPLADKCTCGFEPAQR